jgi:dTDP-4-amino-4,6-dideoxygalactose transaminase
MVIDLYPKTLLKEPWVDKIKNYLHIRDGHDLEKTIEKKICDYTGSKYCTVINSGTNGLFICLKILSTPLDEIIISGYGHPATYKCCKNLGLVPKFADINIETLSMDINKVKELITDNTKAVVHIENNGVVGNDIIALKELCYKNSLYLIEDSAPSLLQKVHGINAGCFGDLGVYSFSFTKPLMCGEGAAIVTDNPEFDNKVKEYRYNSNYMDLTPNLNFNLSPYSISMLLPQFDSLDEVINMRERVHTKYKSFGLNIFEEKGVTNRYPYAMYISENAERVSRKLNSFKIGNRFRYYPVYDKTLKNCLKLQSSIIDLPCHEDLTDREIETICKLIKRVI